ncbi:efflux RND transporter permease subunit [Sneathiella glossodoripedis]|uniref:efflux RND transporter permease subunit n=1 Tax=Sneathiella glossodoripedis TaxID=418853 RepID=UPI00046F3961|nr:MMPL family transporter [Sneathiella glossodoripedis]
MKSDSEFLKKTWMTLAVSFLFVIGVIFSLVADLTPKISPDFFFGSHDPEMADTQKIADLFPAEEFIILNVAGQNIRSPEYLRSISNLTDKLKDLGGFQRILSLTSGPQSPSLAIESPFWRPLLVEQNEQASFILAFVQRQSDSTLVSAIEEIVAGVQKNAGLGEISISGMPYIAEHMRRNIARDAAIFSPIVVLVFAAMIFAVFRSPVITIGAILSGVVAILCSFTGLTLLQQPVGILTANLAIIIFVLTQSQIIYLTNNFRSSAKSGVSRTVVALKTSLLPALLCFGTTFLGFTSLLLVSAEPLRQLGVGGMMGSVFALCAVIFIFPAFLNFAHLLKVTAEKQQIATEDNFKRRLILIGAIVILIVSAIALPGLLKLNADPGLLGYFKPDSEIGTGLKTIDQNGGSSPLQLVVRLKTSEKLDTEQAYQKLWVLHNAYQQHPAVGTVLSLPALLAEANNHPLAFILPWREIVTLLKMESNQQVVDNFLGPDRKNALFLLRMKEQYSNGNRHQILSDLEKVTSSSGFVLELQGGIYSLQAHLTHLLRESVFIGVSVFLLIFAALSYAMTQRLTLSFSMVATATVIPIIVLGINGWLSNPLDIISAPAINISLGLGVDALIHLGMAVQRHTKIHKREVGWRLAISEQVSGIVIGSLIIAIGFAIFAVSEFPPTVRFGLIVTTGALVTAVTSLCAFPVLDRLMCKQRN